MASSSPPPSKFVFLQGLRHWLAFNLGVDQSRKLEIYEDLLATVCLSDVSYWMQVLFSAGIATLGLVLNSPAVIIGAMLISPLMGPILANGMAFAVGDLVLAARALVCLNLSCLIAVLFAVFLIAILPFKEQTAEIAARTQPNLLDLVIAIFSGALGAIATAKKPKGVVTSIPGVAIAVALMPPLCVVGYGIGRTISLQALDGLKIALGGGLLFVTNLTAITLMAMLIFFVIRVDTPLIKNRAEEWHRKDPESKWMRAFFERLPGISHLEVIGSLRNRFIVILVPILILMIPLGGSFSRLQGDIAQQQRRNYISAKVNQLWQEEKLSVTPEKQERAFIDSLNITFPEAENEPEIEIQMRVLTRAEGFTPEEEERFKQRLADSLQKSRQSNEIVIDLIQIPTSSSALVQQFAQAQKSAATAPRIKNVGEAQSELWALVNNSLRTLAFPDGSHQLLGYGVALTGSQALEVDVTYLSRTALQPETQSFLTQDIQRRLGLKTATVKFEHIERIAGKITFLPKEFKLSPTAIPILERIATLLNRYPELKLTATSNVSQADFEEDENRLNTDALEPPIRQRRFQAIQDYLAGYDIDRDRIQLDISSGQITTDAPQVQLNFVTNPSLLPGSGGGDLNLEIPTSQP